MITVLVIEDNLDFQKVLVTWLYLENFFVLTAENGAVGLQMIRTEQPDMVLCDLHMPILDGMSLLKLIRQEPKIANTFFFIMTAGYEDAAYQEAQRYRVDGWIDKSRIWERIPEIIAGRFR